jgi:hypothetical protein
MGDRRTAVCRADRPSHGGGSSKRAAKGLPGPNAHVLALREAMSVGSADPTGVYFGRSTGQLLHTRGEVDDWSLLADFLPPISAVEVSGPYA